MTLSKVINKKPGVSESLRKKIEEEIKNYNFVPNNSARNLAGKKNNIIGLFFKVPSVNQNNSFTASHFSTEFTNYAIGEGKKRGYKVLISIVDEDYEEINQCFSSGIISGAILLGYGEDDCGIEKIISEKNRLVLVNYSENNNNKNVSMINMDDITGSYLAMKNLIEYGHKNILYIGSSSRRLPALRRERGVKDFLNENTQNMISLQIKRGDFSKKSGYEIMKNIFKNSKKDDFPTGVFSANDFMAIGAMEAIKEQGLKIPDDISIIGFDNIEIAKYLDPPLSSIKSDFKIIAEKSVATLVDLIEEKEVPFVQECATEFVKRKSLGFKNN